MLFLRRKMAPSYVLWKKDVIGTAPKLFEAFMANRSDLAKQIAGATLLKGADCRHSVTATPHHSTNVTDTIWWDRSS